MRYINDADVNEILQDISDLIDQNNNGALLNILIDTHPADIAYLLTQINKDSRKQIFHLLPTDLASSVLTELDTPIVEQILEDTSDKKISTLVDEMDSDDAADFISELPEEVATRVLDHVTDEVSEDVKELLLYEEDTAGGIMALEFVAVNEKSIVNEAIEAIREAKDEVDDILSIWVVNDSKTLLGSISLTDLVLAKGISPISSIMNQDIQFVYTDMDQEDVAIIFRKYDHVVVPVVNKANQLVGQITIDDIVDVLDEEAAEDISMFAGARDEELQEESFLKISWLRFPWLMVAFLGELVSAVVIQNFETSLQQIIALIFFVPVIMAMGGNSGIQSSIIVIRGLATGEISVGNTRLRFFRELRVSLLLGVVFGILMMSVVGTWLGNYRIGLLIGVALNIVIVQAALFGGLIPFLLKRLNVDPALASGPFITTFNDVLGLLIYLALITLTIPFIL